MTKTGFDNRFTDMGICFVVAARHAAVLTQPAEAVLAYFDQPLALLQASHALRHVAALELVQAEARRRQVAHTGVFRPTPEVEAAHAAFEALRPPIVQRLYELIEHHIELFP